MALNSPYIISETWVLQLSSGQNRGRIMGFYTTVLASGFALGPFILALTGSGGMVAFGILIVILSLTTLALFSIRGRMPEFEKEGTGSIRSFLPLAPGLLMVVGMLAYFEQGMLSLLPVYGLHHNLTETFISFSVGILVAGNVVMQFPIGWATDKVPRQRIMLICILLTAAGGFLLPLAINSRVFLWPLLFFWGGFSFGSYTVALAELGDRFSGRMLLTGNAAFGLAWGVGGIIGPATTGAAMDLFGPGMLPLSMGLGFVVLALVFFWPKRSDK
jgi:MFS family permease